MLGVLPVLYNDCLRNCGRARSGWYQLSIEVGDQAGNQCRKSELGVTGGEAYVYSRNMYNRERLLFKAR